MKSGIKFGMSAPMSQYSTVDGLGFDYIELAGVAIAAMTEEEFSSAAATLHQGRVKCCGFNTSLPGDLAICGDDFDLEKVASYAHHLCGRGQAISINAIGIGSPKSRHFLPGDNLQLAWQQTEAFLTCFAQIAQGYGLDVYYESLNGKDSHFGLSLTEGADLVKRLNLPNLHLVFDLYHHAIQQETVADLRYALPHIRHVHIAQPLEHGRCYPTAEYKEFYQSRLKILIESGYQGVISTEVFTDNYLEGGEMTLALLADILGELEGAPCPS